MLELWLLIFVTHFCYKEQTPGAIYIPESLVIIIIPDAKRSVYLFSCMKVLSKRDWYCCTSSLTIQYSVNLYCYEPMIYIPGGGFLIACFQSSTVPYWALPDPVPTPLSPVQSSTSPFRLWLDLGGRGGGAEIRVSHNK